MFGTTHAQDLVAENDADTRRLLDITLGQQYQLMAFDNGAAALAAVRQHRPRLVLLDVMMPGDLNGLEVLEAIKKDPLNRDILVAMVTARGQAADDAIARALGADAYFVKPFSPRQLLKWVQDKMP